MLIISKDYFSQRFEIECHAINQIETFCLHTLKIHKANWAAVICYIRIYLRRAVYSVCIDLQCDHSLYECLLFSGDCYYSNSFMAKSQLQSRTFYLWIYWCCQDSNKKRHTLQSEMWKWFTKWEEHPSKYGDLKNFIRIFFFSSSASRYLMFFLTFFSNQLKIVDVTFSKWSTFQCCFAIQNASNQFQKIKFIYMHQKLYYFSLNSKLSTFHRRKIYFPL